MKLYHINTDSDIRAKNEEPTYEEWFRRDMAFTGDKEGKKGKHAPKKLKKDDVLFVYHSGVYGHVGAYVGVAVVSEPWKEGEIYEGNKRLLYTKPLHPYEYQIKIRWVQDWRSAPKKSLEFGLDISKTPQFSLTLTEIDPVKYPLYSIYAPGYAMQSLDEYTTSLEKAIAKSKTDSNEVRLRRLEMAPKKPDLIPVTTTVFKRNPDVIAEVLKRANGVCEGCNNVAPFPRKIDGSPYLEVHHIVMLSDGGDDTVQNAQALCPNCHRKAHYG